MEEVLLKTRDWERLLSVEEKEKYRFAIRAGYFSEFHGSEWKHKTFYGAYIWKYPNYVNVVRIFERLVGHRPLWEDITDDNLRDLFEEIEKHYSPNSVKTITATIKSIINENDVSKGIKSEKFRTILRRKAVPVQVVYLDDREIDRIIRFVPHGKNQRFVQRMFIMECLCGARMSDCMHLTVDNIDETGRMLVYVAQKTHTEVRVPVHRKLREFLVQGQPEPFVSASRQENFNRVLRDICKRCGIDSRVKVFIHGKEMTGKKYQFVSSHTGRRSFATNLAKKGVSIEQIALMMGHMNGNTPNVMMTQHYIVGKMSLTKETLKIFGYYDKPDLTKAMLDDEDDDEGDYEDD